jgi:Domain of unknown function (DUF4304)
MIGTNPCKPRGRDSPCDSKRKLQRQNPAVATAQDTYAEMLKTLVAPGLRAIGFKGSGQNYRLPSDDYWAMLGFQKSTSSDAAHVRFTANVLVVSRSAWDAVRAESPHLPEPNGDDLLGDVRLAEADRGAAAGW